MDESEDNMSTKDVKTEDSPSVVKVKPRKRSMIERELETSLTARVTSPVTNVDASSTSRYGRSRRLKTESECTELEKLMKQIKSPGFEKTPVKAQSPAYKMHASNSPIKTEPKETPMKVVSADSSLENQIENIYQENIMLSRFSSDEKKKSPGTRFPKVYVRKDLIQKREKEETVVLIKNMFSPVQSPYKSTNSHLSNILERSSEKYHLNTASKHHKGYVNTPSVVKTLDFDSNKKKKKENQDSKVMLSKSDLFDMEAKCEYQVGDLAWARMGTYPFWPCIVTWEPYSGMFVKKKMFGRIERDIVHVTFFGDNGRRGWIVETMLRKFLGQLEFETTRERFSPTAKKRDPRLYAAYFVSEKKMPQWTVSVEEAEMLLREPKRHRIDILHNMLLNGRVTKSGSKSRKSGKITRTASDVSLSESLYDTLFSEDDGKTEDPERARNKMKKSLDVSEVVTACLDNMAAKTGITKIQKQSHMDRWLQKAKSKTPEKLQAKVTPPRKEREVKVVSSKKKKKMSPTVPIQKPYCFRKSVYESQNLKLHNEHDYSSKVDHQPEVNKLNDSEVVACYDIGVTAKVELLNEENSTDDMSKNAQLSTDNIETTNLVAFKNKTHSDQLNAESTDADSALISDTVDEIKANKFNVEENGELGDLLTKEKTLKTSEASLDKSKNEVECMEVDFGIQTETTVEPKLNQVDSDSMIQNEVELKKPTYSLEVSLDQLDDKLTNDNIENVDMVDKHSENVIDKDANSTTVSENEIDSMEVDSGNVSEEISSKVSEADFNMESELIHADLEQNIEINSRKNEESVEELQKKEDLQIVLNNAEKNDAAVVEERITLADLDKPLNQRIRRSLRKCQKSPKLQVEDKPGVQNHLEKTYTDSKIDVEGTRKQAAEKPQVFEIVTETVPPDSKNTTATAMTADKLKDNKKTILRKRGRARNRLLVSNAQITDVPDFDTPTNTTLINLEKQAEIKETESEKPTQNIQILENNIETIQPVSTQIKESSHFNSGESINKSSPAKSDDRYTRSYSKRLSLKRNSKKKYTATPNEIIESKSVAFDEDKKEETKEIVSDNLKENAQSPKIEQLESDTNIVSDKLEENSQSPRLELLELDTKEENTLNKSETITEAVLDEHAFDEDKKEETKEIVTDNLKENAQSPKIEQLELDTNIVSDKLEENAQSPEIEQLELDTKEETTLSKSKTSAEAVLDDHQNDSKKPKLQSTGPEGLQTEVNLPESEELSFSSQNHEKRSEINSESNSVISGKPKNDLQAITEKKLLEITDIDSKQVMESIQTNINDEVNEGTVFVTDSNVPLSEGNLPLSTEDQIKNTLPDPKISDIDVVDSSKLEESLQNVLEKKDITPKKQKSLQKVLEDQPVESSLEEEIEYGHLEFIHNESKIVGNEIMEEMPKKQFVNNMDAQLSEEEEYGHLDFIFSSCDKNIIGKDTDLAKEVGNDSKSFPSPNDISTKIVTNKSVAAVNDSKQRELRVSVEKLPLASLESFTLLKDKLNKVTKDSFLDKTNNSETSLKDVDESAKSAKKHEHKSKFIENTYIQNEKNDDTVSDMSVDGDLDEKLIHQDSFETDNARDNEDMTKCEKNNPIDGKEHKSFVETPAADKLLENCNTKEHIAEKEQLEVDIELKTVDTESHNIVICTEENKTEERTNIDSQHETVPQEMLIIGEGPINESNANHKKNGMDDTFMMSVNRLPDPVKLNGFHIDDCFDFSDGELNAETSSINSEDSEPLSVTKSKLISKSRSKAKKALDNTDFVKYLELRQDALMDEHPELNQDEIVEYLYKTWQYEENTKSDIEKNDNIEQSGLVKGLNQNLRQKSIRNNFRQSKKRNKKRDEDSLSINSDISDTSVKKRLRTKRNKSSASSVEETDSSVNQEISLQIKTELLDNTSMNPDVTNYAMETSIPVEVSETALKTTDLHSSHQNDMKNDSTDEVNDKLEEVRHKKPSNREKSKSPKNKENSIKNYFKVASPADEPIVNHNDQNIMHTDTKIKEEYDPETASINSESSEVSISKRKSRKYGDKQNNKSLTDPEFLKYLELRQDGLIDENPQLTQEEITNYLFKTWLYEESVKSDIKKTDDIEQASLVKGLNEGAPQPKRIKKKIKVEKDVDGEMQPKDKPKRKTSQPYYNEDLSDIEDEIEMFEIFKPKKKLNMITTDSDGVIIEDGKASEEIIDVDEYDEVELYFSRLTEPKPNVFKGLVREKVCEICERTDNLIKCIGCNCMFHDDCVKKAAEVVEIPAPPTRGRKKKKKPGRKPKSVEDSESQSDDKSQDVSEEFNASIEEDIESRTVNAEDFEVVLETKMQELLSNGDTNYDSYSSDDCVDWTSAAPGKCEIIDVKLKPKIVTDYSNFKCNNCQIHSPPICFVCKQAVSKTGVPHRQKCQTARCCKYYHLECLEHWPQTQYYDGEPSKNSKKNNEHFESVVCPRHVCHTCVSDDPRGCKTRFSGDKLARCVRCPATYHSFTKCLPAGSQILTGSLIVCPRHYEHRPGKVPCHVNTGWCFICALGGSLICCEYCPTSFHAECLNIKPPEGGYMCEDCETGRLPLYGEMVWVKLGHYRWWPGIVLHPSEIPENIMAVKHSPGEFVVRFFGQYDHYWVNRGRVFPFQEGDSGKISSQKSKIDAAFTTAIEHAQRACEILKTAPPNDEESLDIASSLLPPHYVKLKVNKPCGSLCGRRVDVEESSLTQCECDPADLEPCGAYSHCLNRMLLTECGPICRAGDRCSNRAFEKRQYPKMVPYRTPHRGWGLKTLEDIKAGQFVIEYVGELIDEEEFKRRMNRKHEIRDENFYFLTLDKERMIDAGPKGNLARFMNHCCEPNCETQKWTVLGDARVGLFALYDIPANSELTFNYNLECAGIEKKRCMCGAKRCSGYIGAKPKQEEAQPKKKLLGKRTYKKRKPVEESPTTSQIKPKRPVGRPAKPRELTEIEKDLLIIKNATNGLSSDSEGSGRLSSIDSERNPKALKRKRVSFSTEDSSKRVKVDENSTGVGD